MILVTYRGLQNRGLQNKRESLRRGYSSNLVQRAVENRCKFPFIFVICSMTDVVFVTDSCSKWASGVAVVWLRDRECLPREYQGIPDDLCDIRIMASRALGVLCVLCEGVIGVSVQ
jgi:hypothetical protein